MQFSESWLRSLCNPALSSAELCQVLTMAGLEVEKVESAAGEFSGVVAAQVLSAEKHPHADKLKLCRVDVGQGVAGALQIVCGAPNVAAGMKVPCALVGARLPGIEIGQATVRGIASFGMLCSARELGLGEDASGLLVLPDDAHVGSDLRALLDLDDSLITLKLTPNRADCLSLTGVARELSALTGAPLTLPEVAPVAATHADQRSVLLEAPDACPRYCGRVVRGLDARAPTPDWMRRRITRSGIRPISALVDVTNYVMLELGQPLHAFDNARLAGAVHVRYPAPGEKLLLLNEQAVEPARDTALIADDERALAIAGVMGGEDTGISESTTDLFLESAFFAPAAIAGKARRLGFSSDASHRYERGVDYDLSRRAMERATQLIVDICGGEPGPIVEAVSVPHLPTRMPLRLRVARVATVLGVELGADAIEAILNKLGLAVERRTDDFLVTAPPYRFDIEIEEDLIEEIARVYGYDNIPSRPPRARMAMLPITETVRTPMALRRLAAERGYHEVVNFSFVDAAWETDFAANATPVALANPIASQMSVMRSSLIGGLVGTLVANRKRQMERVRVFELGRCFRRETASAVVDGFAQPYRLAGLAAGLALPEQWGATAAKVDFYDVKADVEALFAPRCPEFSGTQHPALHPGRSAALSLDGRSLGVLGELHPRWVQKYELGAAPVVFELDLDALRKTPFPRYADVSRFPVVIRDLALVVPQSQTLAPLLTALRGAAPAIVRDVAVFDVYQGKGLAENEKSLAFRIVMQDTQRTLEEPEVEAAMIQLLAIATSDFNAHLRE